MRWRNSPAKAAGIGLAYAVMLLAQAPEPRGAGLETGTLPARWMTGGPDCATVPKWQIHAYNPDFYILRESGCLNYEKPFLYLIFGKDRALLEDTGVAQNNGVAEAVEGVVAEWCKRNGRTSTPLVVAHSHAHGDHIAGDSQFKDKPNVTLIGLDVASVQKAFGVANWPTDLGSIDLGDRMLDVIPIPGHQPASIALYDRRTGILLTGDTLYPGRLYVSDFPAFAASIQRLVDFTRDKPVAHVLGCHIEQSNTPFLDYVVRTKYQPDEHALELSHAHLVELNEALKAMNGHPVRYAMRDFTIWPK